MSTQVSKVSSCSNFKICPSSGHQPSAGVKKIKYVRIPWVIHGTHMMADLRNQAFGAGEMAQQESALTTLSEFLSSISNSHVVAHNHLCDLMPSSGMEMYIQTEHSLYKINKSFLKRLNSPKY